MTKGNQGASGGPQRGGWRANPLANFDKRETDEPCGKRFERIAAECGDRTAVKFGDAQMTFRELDCLSNRLARRIVESVGTENEPVVALLEEGISPYIAMLGALKAGKIYAPLDASYPAARIEYMLSDTQARVVVTENSCLKLAEGLRKGQKVINLDDGGGDASDAPLDVRVSPDAISNILYTSGSTGQPKGVFNTHRHLTYGAAVFQRLMGLTASDRAASFGSFAFAGGMKLGLWILMYGATAISWKLKNVDSLAGLFEREEVSVATLSPTLLRHFLASVRDGRRLGRLRIFYIGGEPLHGPEVERFKELFPKNVALLNVLAMTEVGSLRQFVANEAGDLDGDLVPVGYPLGEVEIQLLDDDRRPVKPGEIGQIAAKGHYIALGYWRKDEATKAAFLEDNDGSGKRTFVTGDLGRMDDDGCLVHLGRKDLMVKVRGYRIEVAEVEAALRGHAEVADVAVAAPLDKRGEQRLVAYIVPRTGARVSVDDLRRAAAAKLPEYMIPSTFVELEALPFNLHGKVDRSALPAPAGERPRLDNGFVAPRTPVEERLAAIWGELLGIGRVGVEDDFFALGGHSILAAQAVSRMNDAFGITIPVTALFLEPTVARMAVAVTQQLAASATDEELRGIMDELESQ